eukprot:1240012-Pyramimonas_sp.AAC.1
MCIRDSSRGTPYEALYTVGIPGSGRPRGSGERRPPLRQDLDRQKKRAAGIQRPRPRSQIRQDLSGYPNGFP